MTSLLPVDCEYRNLPASRLFSLSYEDLRAELGMRMGMNSSSAGLFMPTVEHLWYLFLQLVALCVWSWRPSEPSSLCTNATCRC